MKLQLFLLAIIICFISCDNNKKYKGKWRLDVFKSTNDEIKAPFSIIIKNDSIRFDYSSFNHSHTFPLKIEKEKLIFNNWTVNSNITEDTLSLQNTFYIKDQRDSILNWWQTEPITKIELPQTSSKYFNSPKNPLKTRKTIILFGKRIDNNKFSLQLNDKHANTTDLVPFLDPGHSALREEHSPFITIYFISDKDSKMKDIEKIFTTMSRIGSQRIKLINNINLHFNDSIGVYYNYESIIKILPVQHINETYYSKIINKILPPPPPFNHPFFDDFHPISKVILLKKDKIYFNNKIITPSELKALITPWIKNNNALFSLYDLESTYGSFLEMNAIITSVYNETRDSQSKLQFNKNLNQLNREELTEIKLEIPLYHVWSYSIPHYNSIVEKENSFFGLKAEPID